MEALVVHHVLHGSTAVTWPLSARLGLLAVHQCLLTSPAYHVTLASRGLGTREGSTIVAAPCNAVQ